MKILAQAPLYRARLELSAVLTFVCPSVAVADVAEAPVAPAAPVNKKDDDAAAEAPASPPRTARKHREKSPAREPASATGWRKSVRSRNTPDRFPGTIMM